MAGPLERRFEMGLTEITQGGSCSYCGMERQTYGGLCWDCQMDRTGGNWAEQWLAEQEYREYLAEQAA